MTKKILKSINFLELLKIAVEEEHWFLQAHQNRVAFYVSFISAILAATIAGLMEASTTIHYAILIIGPIIVFAISTIALDGTLRFYQRVLEAISVRAKLEQALGMTDVLPSKKQSPGYWKAEPLIPPRHLESRKSLSSSSEFIEKQKNSGYQKSTRRFFRFFQILSTIFAGVLLALSIGII